VKHAHRASHYAAVYTKASRAAGSGATVSRQRKPPYQPDTVEAVYHEGTLFLLDSRTLVVFSSERDADSNLVPVGVYNKQSKEVEFKHMQRSKTPDSQAVVRIVGVAARCCMQLPMFVARMPNSERKPDVSAGSSQPTATTE
jgi:hypothetical protein